MATRNALFHDIGQEGPRHDPYTYEETSFINLKGEMVVLHEGLDCYFIDVDGEKHRFFGDDYYKKPVELFEKFVGLDMKVIHKLIERREHPDRCPKCKSKHTKYMDGYPGETYELCAKCGAVVSYSFNEAAVR